MKHSKFDQLGFTLVELMIATTVFATVLLIVTFGIVHLSNDYYKGINSSATQTAAADAMSTIAQAIELGPSSFSLSSDPSGLQVLCAGSQEFVFLPGTTVQRNQDPSKTNVGIYQLPVAATSHCDKPSDLVALPRFSGGQDLLNPNMLLVRLSIDPVGTGPACDAGGSGIATDANVLCKVSVTVAFGNDDDLFCDATISNPLTAGSCEVGGKPFNSASPMDSLAHDVQANPADIRCLTQADSHYCAVSALSTTVGRRL